MRTLLIGIAFVALAACQPAAVDTPVAEVETTELVAETGEFDEGEPLGATFVHASETGAASLQIQEGTDPVSFGLTCKLDGPSLTLTSATSQVALGNMVFPYAISLSGASFDAELVPGDETATTFAVTTPLTPEILSALSGATTARIFVNGGYAFVESGVDTGDEFERFATACSDLTGMAAAP